MPTQCAGFGFLDYTQGMFPNSEYLGESGLHVGVHQDLTRELLDYLISVIESFLEKHVEAKV
jgi:dTDP-4-amino-4,6-dideoxygalactose transaminase